MVYDPYGLPEFQWGQPGYNPPPAPAPAPAPVPNWTMPESWMAQPMPAAPMGALAANPYGQTFGGGGGGGGGGLFPAGTEVYGGSGWMEQLAQQMYQMFMANMQQEMATGYVTPAERPRTKTDAYNAIYESRPDLQEQHQRKYEDWSVSRYMQHWWEGSGEMAEGRHWTDPATGREWVNTGDVTPIQFAIARGYLNPGKDAGDDYGMEPTDPTAGDWRPPLKGDETEAEIAALYEAHALDDAPWTQWPEKQATLAREEFEAGQQQWQQEFLQLQGLTDTQIKQIEETLKLNREKYDLVVIESNRNFLRLQGLDEDDLRRWEVEQEQLKDLTAEEKRRWNLEWARDEEWNEELIRQFEEQQTYSYYVADQQQAQFELDQLRLAGVEETRALEFQQTHQLALDEFNVGSQQWKAEFGLEERRQTEEERYNRLQQELEMMGLMTQQQGPRDWLQYGALQRQVGPGWQDRLLSGQGFAPFEAGAPMPVATEGVQFAPELAQAGWPDALMQQGLGYIQPQTISPQQFANMLPSEREQLAGLVETPQELGGYGGWADDYFQRMMAAWPTGGQVQGISSFGGW